MKQCSILLVLIVSALSMNAQPIAVGSGAPDFSLKNIDGAAVSLSDYVNEKGVMVIFSCNPCPYVKAYEDRMIALHNEFAPQGAPVDSYFGLMPHASPVGSSSVRTHISL